MYLNFSRYGGWYAQWISIGILWSAIHPSTLGDYNNLRDIPRPSHADFTARMRYGDKVDMRGGGHFSARLHSTSLRSWWHRPSTITRKRYRNHGHLKQVGTIQDAPINMVHPDMKALASIATEPIAMVDAQNANWSRKLGHETQKDGDSTGGIVEVVATGLPIGLGNPNFDGIENRLARVIFGVPAIKAYPLAVASICVLAWFRSEWCFHHGRRQNNNNYQ